MADIKKTLSQLMTDYADNNAGAITPQLLRNGFNTVVGSMAVSAVTSNYPATGDDIFLNVIPSGSDITVTLPNVLTFIEKYYIIKNSGTSNNVIVAGSVDSATNYTLLPGQVLAIESNGTTWVSYNKPTDLSSYATSASVSTLSADVQNKLYTSASFTKTSADTLYETLADAANKAYTSAVNTQVNNLSSVYQPIGTYITSAQVSATYATIASVSAISASDATKLTKTSADTLYQAINTTLTKTSADTLYAPISTSATINGLSATYETLSDAANKLYTSAAFTKTSADSLYAPIGTSATINNLSATYATIVSVSALSADEQNKLYTSAAFTKTSADSLYAPISTSATINNLSATYETLSDAANKLYTSAAFTKTSADTLYAPIGTSATINNLSATYATIASVSALSADEQNKLYTSAAFTKTSADTLYAPISTSATINNLSATYATIASVSAVSASDATKLTKTSADTLYAPISGSNVYQTLADAANKAYTSAISAALNAQDASTGIYFGGTITKVDATHFSVSATKGWVIDSVTNLDSPLFTFVNYAGSASILDQFVGVSGTATYMLLTSAGNILQLNSYPTPIQKRQNMYLGYSYHLSANTIQNVVNDPDIKINEMSQVRDMFSALKYINKGMTVVANGANMALNQTGGSLFGLGVNWVNNTASPTKLDLAGQTSAIFQYRTQTDAGTANLSSVDAINYDLNGVITAIPASGPAGSAKDKAQATNQRVFISPSGLIRITYGQTVYVSLAAAIAGLTSEVYIQAPSLSTNLQLIGIISVTKGATALNNVGVDAQFTLPSMFGEVSVGAGGLMTTNLQQAYLNSPIPQITITSGNGPVEIQSYDNSSLTFAILNSSGTTVIGMSANGAVSATSAFANVLIQNGTPISATYQTLADAANKLYTSAAFTKTSADTLYASTAVLKDPTGFFNPESVTLTYSTSARTVTLGGPVSAYWYGALVPTLSAGWTSSPCPTGTSATQYLYYNGTSAIWSSTPWTFDVLQIALVGIDQTDTVQFAERECHGMMNWESHKDLHNNIGTYITSTGAGGDLSSYTLNSTTTSARQPYISALTLNDEDLQTINPTLSTSAYMQYSLSTSAAYSIFTSGTDIIQLSGNQPQYNLNTGGVWGQALIPNNQYGAIFLAAIPVTSDTLSQAKRYLWIQPQQVNATLATIQALTPNSLTLGNLPSITPEIVFFGRVIVRFAAGNWTIIQVDKIIGSKISQTAVTGSTGLTTVSTDGATLSGSGTAGSPLGLSAQGTAGTYNNVVVDQYGRVTSGGNTTTSGGSGATPKYASVIPILSCNSTQTLSTGASNNFFAYGERFVLDFDTTFTTSSTIQYCPINASGNMIMGVYKIVPGSAYPLMFGSSATFAVANGVNDAAVGVVVSGTLLAGVPYAMVLFHSMNAPTFLALSNTTTNLTPYISWTAANQGTMTSATATVTPQNESMIRFFAGLKV